MSQAGVVNSSGGSNPPIISNYKNVTFVMSPYLVQSTDNYISVDTSGGPVSLVFSATPTFKETWTVKDRTGNASQNNITITTVGQAINIDGQKSVIIQSNFGALNLIANSTPTYEVF